MKLEKFFSAEDLRLVEEAVREAESRTSGEIVPYAVERSDAYPEATWSAATLGALLGVLAAAAVQGLVEIWGVPLAAWIAAPAALGAGGGALLCGALPELRRALVPAVTLGDRVAGRAERAFLEHEVFATRERTGILVFLSLFERRVVVRADRGIAAKVAQAEWDAVVEGIVSGIREGKPGEALARGIRACGGILERSGVERRADDRDELPDGLRTGGP